MFGLGPGYPYVFIRAELLPLVDKDYVGFALEPVDVCGTHGT